MVYHANATWLPGGFLGVEVFFVISGYLITLLLIGEHERSGRVRVCASSTSGGPGGCCRRCSRCSCCSRRTPRCSGADALGQLRGDVIAGLTYVSNWYQIWVGQGYTATGDFAPLRHLWSLAVEEQFYLLWPLVMIVHPALGDRGACQDVSWALVVAAVAIAAVVGRAVPRRARSARARSRPTPTGRSAGAASPRSTCCTCRRRRGPAGLLLGAALAMVWRPVALMRGPMRRRGRAARRRRRARPGRPRRADAGTCTW